MTGFWTHSVRPSPCLAWGEWAAALTTRCARCTAIRWSASISDAERIRRHQEEGRKALHGDPSDADFWEKIEQNHSIQRVMLALPNIQANLDALEQLRNISFAGRVAAIARFPDEVKRLQEAGATSVFNIYTEAGAGFANHVESQEAREDA